MRLARELRPLYNRYTHKPQLRTPLPARLRVALPEQPSRYDNLVVRLGARTSCLRLSTLGYFSRTVTGMRKDCQAMPRPPQKTLMILTRKCARHSPSPEWWATGESGRLSTALVRPDLPTCTPRKPRRSSRLPLPPPAAPAPRRLLRGRPARRSVPATAPDRHRSRPRSSPVS